ncbi:hypothetical protein B4N89_21970 [Embleya scabrispora]|uniref:Uncharacterized protein n=1 Tax=Embleya scabrispora TaxID=159449 RepID=A0A1T3P2A4_9ACTN|nr:hypothetical protein [Embleya scabrispora]OPC83249.1 hypothetical protein B4N89_21970 [Embleya scabrispora]
MRIACRTHRGRGRAAAAGCAIPASIGPALVGARTIGIDISPELSNTASFGEFGDFDFGDPGASGDFGDPPDPGSPPDPAGRPDYIELDEETLSALRLFAAEGMFAAPSGAARESGEPPGMRRPADRRG